MEECCHEAWGRASIMGIDDQVYITEVLPLDEVVRVAGYEPI